MCYKDGNKIDDGFGISVETFLLLEYVTYCLKYKGKESKSEGTERW